MREGLFDIQRAFLLCAIWGILVAVSTSCAGRPQPVVGIVGAFDLEVAFLRADLSGARTRTIQGIRFHTGELEGRRVVIATSGVGKVNAAVATILLIEHFRPNEIVVTGVAGALSPNLEPGDVVIAAKVAHHDQGEYTPDGFWPRPSRSPFSGQESPPYFPSDKGLLELAQQAVADRLTLEELDADGLPIDAQIGVIISGDAFISSLKKRKELHELFRADAVDMESAAIAQVCWQQGVSFLAIRGISDQANEDAIHDARAFTEIAALNAATVVRRVLGGLNSKPHQEVGASEAD